MFSLAPPPFENILWKKRLHHIIAEDLRTNRMSRCFRERPVRLADLTSLLFAVRYWDSHPLVRPTNSVIILLKHIVITIVINKKLAP